MAASKLSQGDLNAFKDAFYRWCRTRKKDEHVSFLLTGKTGVGKSRLVNALVGEPVAVEGKTKDRCTSMVTRYSINIQGIEVRIWDSPGLQDGTCNEESYLADMEEKLRKGGMDVMIYCLKMDDTRFHEDDKRAIRTLTRAFGKKLWNNAVIALTFANKVKDPDARDKEDKRAYFMRDLAYWREAIELFFTRDLKIDYELFQAIPIVPTGNYRKLHLPNCDNWLSELWIQCYCVMKDSAALNLYRINKERVKFPGSDQMADACGSPENETRQTVSTATGTSYIPREIPLNEKQQDSFWKKTWNAFKTVAKFVLCAGYVVLKFIFPLIPF